MKTRNEYLSDLEFSKEEIQNLTKKDIKTRYRKLIKEYNVDVGALRGKNNSNSDKYRLIIEAYEALDNNKYLDEPELIIEDSLTIEDTAQIYSKALIDFLERAAFNIDLKKNDNKVVIIDNHVINFDVSKLKKTKFLAFNKTKILKLVRK